MLDIERKVERGIIVFCNWMVFGLIGLGFLLEGGARNSFLTGLIGIAGIVAGFVGHIIINFVFRQSFTLGETVLGLAMFAIFVLVFSATWLGGEISQAGFLIGLSLMAVLVVGFLVYTSTRYGVRGAFDRFDVMQTRRPDRKK